MFNIEILGMDNFCTFHQEKHSEKTCPQWNHNMNTMMENLVGTLLIEETTEQNEETNEPVVTEDNLSVEHSINMFNIVYNIDKESVDQSTTSEAPPKKSTNRYNLRRKGPIFEKEIKKQLLCKILSPSNSTQNSYNKSRGAPPSKNTSTNNKTKSNTLAPGDKATPRCSSTQTIVMVSTYYNILEYMKSARAKISLFEITRITDQHDVILQVLSLRTLAG